MVVQIEYENKIKGKRKTAIDILCSQVVSHCVDRRKITWKKEEKKRVNKEKVKKKLK